mmetsp:Transcript_9357/g.23300  ORF Transcript_9357/g.23300 Transcript_9357/m.23300 type:complete len:287 (+) Transcript_9357:265-1125(+)
MERRSEARAESAEPGSACGWIAAMSATSWLFCSSSIPSMRDSGSTALFLRGGSTASSSPCERMSQALTSHSTTGCCALAAASSSGSSPLLARARMSAPCSTSHWTTAMCPPCAAACNGSQPSCVRAEICAPRLTSQRTTSSWPPLAAAWMACQPSLDGARRSRLVYRPRCPHSHLTTSRWPLIAALCSGCQPSPSCAHTFSPLVVRTSHCTSSRCPLSAATWIGSLPSAVRARKLAPRAPRKRATCVCPASTAACSGCHRSVETAATSAPTWSSHSAVPRWPWKLA